MSRPTSVDLAATAFIDSTHPAVVEFSRSHADKEQGPTAKAVALYYAVRDGLRYDPYHLELSQKALTASNILESGRGWCVEKAILLAACCRAQGIPARLGFADVKNHLSTERLRQSMKTDIFYYHGYTSIYLNDTWIKATPAFNLSLCEKFRLAPLEFNGQEDSIYHPFDLEGNRHMEYLQIRGEHSDVPLQELLDAFDKYYPGMSLTSLSGENWDADVDAESTTPV